MRRRFWGVVLVILGVLALLQGTGVYNLGLSFWPVVLTLLGLSITYKSFTRHRGPSWLGLALGLWIGAIGLFDILSDAGVTPGVDGGDIASAGWPILLIALGLSIAIGPRRRTRWNLFQGCDFRHGMVGDLRYGRSPWVLEKDLDVANTVGDLKLDLTTADIAPGTHRITVDHFVGETVIKVPDNVTVRVTAEVNVGEMEVLGDYRAGLALFLEREVVVPGAAAELVVEACQRVGSLRVIRVPAIQVIR